MTENSRIKTLRIVGAPMGLGQRKYGTDLGPSAIRYAGLLPRLERLGFAVHDLGNIPVPEVEFPDSPVNVDGIEGRARNVEAIGECCASIYQAVTTDRADDEFAIVIGGDHSLAIGSVAGAVRHRQIGVVWVDAHGDFNTPQTSPSGSVHGMSVAVLLGDGPDRLVNVGYPGAKLNPSQIVMIGIRNLDLQERLRLVGSGIFVHTTSAIDEHGVGNVTRQALEQLAAFDEIHVSLDMDAVDPDLAPGVGTPEPGGLTYREAHLLMEILAASGKVRSLDIVEVNPILDNRNQTARLAVELAASLLGQRII